MSFHLHLTCRFGRLGHFFLHSIHIRCSEDLFAACVYRHRLQSGPCLHCGYNLHGTTDDTCPECGYERAMVTVEARQKRYPGRVKGSGFELMVLHDEWVVA